MNNQDLNTLIQQGARLHYQGDYLRAIAYFEESATLARVQNNPDYELAALSWVPVNWINIPDPQKALEAATRLLARARELHREDYLMRGACAWLRPSQGLTCGDAGPN